MPTKLKLSQVRSGSFKGNVYSNSIVGNVASAIENNTLSTFTIKDASLQKGDTPDITRYFLLGAAIDSTGLVSTDHRFGHIQTSINTQGTITTEIAVFKNIAGNGEYTAFGIKRTAENVISTFAPTPNTSDNSTQIATTAYVKSNLDNYLPLTGGTISGTLTIGTSGCTLSYNATNQCLDFIFS